MRVAIDGRFLTHPQAGGFRTYTRELTHALVRTFPQTQFLLYVDRKPVQTNDVPTAANVTVKVVPGTLSRIGMPFREQALLPAALRYDRPDVFHAPCLTAPLSLSCPLVLTVHDTLWRRPFAGQETARRILSGYTQMVTERAVTKAAVLLVPSQYVKKCVTDELRVDTERVVVTPEGAPQAAPQRAADASEPYVLCLGSADPRKNLLLLADAWADLPEEVRGQFTLLSVWTNADAARPFHSHCERLGIQGSVRILPAQTDTELIDLYAGATAFLFPSLAEGFGLPVLEAMINGCPVAASQATSLPEVCGDAALLVDPARPDLWTRALSLLLTNAGMRDRLRRKGRRRAALFTWDECARLTHAAYEAAVST